jgi:hypothetical protein
MRFGNLLLSLSTLVLIASRAAADEWSRSFPVSGRPVIHVDTNDGRVTLTTWDKPEIGVHISTRGWHIGSHFNVTAEQKGQDVYIEGKVTPSFGMMFGVYWAHIDISLPRQSDIDIRTGDGSVDVGPLEGDIRVWTGDGHIVARELKGGITLHTGDGGIDASDLDGRLDASSGDGHIAVRGRFETLNLESGDGRITADAVEGSALKSGWSLHTGDGGLTLRVPVSLKADLEASTGDGSISVDMPVQIEGMYKPSRHLHGQLNGGGPLLRLRSGDGSIRLERL